MFEFLRKPLDQYDVESETADFIYQTQITSTSNQDLISKNMKFSEKSADLKLKVKKP